MKKLFFFVLVGIFFMHLASANISISVIYPNNLSIIRTNTDNVTISLTEAVTGELSNASYSFNNGVTNQSFKSRTDILADGGWKRGEITFFNYAWNNLTIYTRNNSNFLNIGQVSFYKYYTGNQTVYGKRNVVEFIRNASIRRVDVAAIGDSNMQRSNATAFFGHTGQVEQAWTDFYGQYGSGVAGTYQTDGWILDFGGGYAFTDPTGGLCVNYTLTTDASFNTRIPNFIANRTLNNTGLSQFPYREYCYNADGTEINNGISLVMATLAYNAPMNVSSSIRWHFTYATFNRSYGVNGTFQPTARIFSPFTFLSIGSIINSSNGTNGLWDGSLTVPQNLTRTEGMVFEPTPVVFGGGMDSPFYMNWQRLESLNKSKGVAFSPMMVGGGQSARGIMTTLVNQSQLGMTEYLRHIVFIQNGTPMLLIDILHGGNDLNDNAASFNLTTRTFNGAVGSSGQGIQNNYLGIINYTRNFWQGAGYNASNLYFMLGGYHPQAGGYLDAAYQYEDAFINISKNDPQVVVVRGSQLATPDFAANASWYAPDGTAHLSGTGFRQWDNITFIALNDITSPVITYRGFAPGVNYTTATVPIFNISTNEESTVIFSFNNGATNVSATTPNSLVFNGTGNSSNGNYTLTIFVTDLQGNSNNTNFSFSVLAGGETPATAPTAFCSTVTSGFSGFYVAIITIMTLVGVVILIFFIMMLLNAVKGESVGMELPAEMPDVRLVMIGILGIAMLIYLIVVIFGILCST